MKKKFSTWVAAIALVLAGVFVNPGAVHADSSSEIASCTVGEGGIGPTHAGGHYTGSGDWYAYSVNLITLSGSACEDIQITNLYSMSPWMKFRIRFYPSSGGSYANSWKYPNQSCWTCNFLLATDVANGTLFRVEGVEQVPGCTPACTQEVIDENYRIAW